MCADESKQNFLSEICDFPIPSYEEWKVAVEKSLKGAAFSKLMTKTYEEIILQPMYQKKDVEHFSFSKTNPGEFPFVRGTKQVGEENSWLIAQEMNHPLVETVNDWLKKDLAKGVNAINVVLNEANKQGLMKTGLFEFEQVGTDVSSLEDMEKLLQDVDVTSIPFVVQTGVSAIPFVSFLAAYFQQQQLSLQSLKGCIGADPIAVLVKNGKLDNSIDNYLDQMAQLVSWTQKLAPELKTIFIDGSSYHDGGGNAVQELACMLATAVFYVRELQKRNLTIDEIATSIKFSVSIGSNMFMELAKIRSLRMLWANIIAQFGGSEEAQKITIHGRTSRWTKTVYDPYNNILRSTVEAFAAAVGGVDSLHVSPFDEAMTLPNEFSRRIARNIQFIIQEEALLTRTVDPAGGSWYVEHLTHELAQKSWTLFQEIEGQGGMLQALSKGYPQQLIEEVAAKKNNDIEKRKLVFVGATMYPNKADSYKTFEYEAINESLQQREVLRKEKGVQNVLIEKASLVEDAIHAAQLGATIEEMNKALADEKSIQVNKINTYRATQAFELLRKYSEQKQKDGDPIKVYLTNIGLLADHKPRTDFITSFFETGGFEIISEKSSQTTTAAIEATLNYPTKVAVICGKNESYSEMAVEIVTTLKQKRPDMKIFIAGKQEEELEKQLQKAGVDGFIFVGSNCYQLLRELQGEKAGVIHE